MDPPLSPILAIIFVEKFEKEALVCYVNDVSAVWCHRLEMLLDFLKHLSGIHPNITFTMEMEVNKSVAFLYVCINKKKRQWNSRSCCILETIAHE